MDINDEEFMKSLLDQLENQSWDQYMNLCYNTIIMFPDQVLQYDEIYEAHLYIEKSILKSFFEKSFENP